MSGHQTSWVHIWIPIDATEDTDSSSPVSDVIMSPTRETSFTILPVKESDSEDERDAEKEYTDTTRSTIPIVERETLENILKLYLETTLKTSRYIKKISDDKKLALYSFQVKSSYVESTLVDLTRRGIGTESGTSVSVVQENVTLGPLLLASFQSQHSLADESVTDLSIKEGGDEKQFYMSVKSRLMVAEVISRIRAGGSFTFDYFMLVLLAGIIAFMGLVDNNSVTLVASMLVSPIMGPILAGIFGSVIRDYTLLVQGIKNETISLLMCIIIGMIFGIMVSLLILYDVYGIIDVSQWPSDEMLSRGRTKGLITGIFVAIPSGAGIALSVLGGNAGSLVGVAISASLLPPAVNAGVFWAVSVISIFYTGNDYELIRGYDGIGSLPSLGCPLPSDNGTSVNETVNNFVMNYSCDLAMEAFISGVVSLTLTILNIVCIILTGYAILRLKEVTPDKIPQTFSNFWKRDVKAHRNYYKTLKAPLYNSQRPELNIFNTDTYHHNIDGTFLHKIFEQAHQDEDYLDITRWVALPQPPPVNNEDKTKNNAKTYERVIELSGAANDEKRRTIKSLKLKFEEEERQNKIEDSKNNTSDEKKSGSNV